MADAPKKPKTTAEILAAARAEMKSAGPSAPGTTPAAVPEPPAASSVAPAPPSQSLASQSSASPAPEATPAKPAGSPKSTSDILAAARAAAAAKTGSAAAPAASTPAAAKPAAPAAGAKPKSTADILAAARAGKAGAAPADAPASPAADKPAKAPKPTAAASAAPAASGLSVEQMLANIRPTEIAPPKAAVPVKAVLMPPPLPPRPVSAKKAEVPRRSLLQEFSSMAIAMVATPFALAWTLFAAWSAAAGLFTARFMLPNVLAEPPRKFKIGSPNDFDLGTVATKLVAQYGVWIVHTDQYKGKNLIYALASVCTHLGCTPSWLEGEQKFKCPCHGSGFYITGVNFEGPAPRPLERVGLRLAEDGMLEVDKSLKFQEEMGQWNDANSFVEIA